MSREEFVAKARDAAVKTSSHTGYSVGLAIAQAALESNWGESQLSKSANNFFGIKAHGKHAAMEFRTNEVVNGNAKQVVARFASYESMEECFQCRGRMIESSAVYAEARAAKDDVVRFAHELGKHWATDPKYAEKVLRIYVEHGFERFDGKGLE